MEFELIELVGCDRLSKPNIQIRPTKKVQMILGTNGSGKSSLLSLGYSPLPPEPEYMSSNGRWKVILTHLGDRYELSASYKKGKGHNYSFILNDKELNESHNVTTQLALTEEKLHYNRDLHAILTEEVEFTRLSPLQRRDLISKFSASDLTLAFKEYNRFKKGQSNAQSIVSFLEKRLVDVKSKLLDDKTYTLLKEKVSKLNDDLASLMVIPKPTDILTLGDMETKLQKLLSEMDTYLMLPYPSQLDYNFEIESTKTRITILQERIRVVFEELNLVDTKINQIKSLFKLDPDVLRSELNEVSTELSTLYLPKDIGVPMELLVEADVPIFEIKKIVSQLPDCDFDKERYLSIQTDLNASTLALSKAQITLDGIIEHLKWVESIHSVDCPHCKTKFKPGVDLADVNLQHERKAKGTAYISDLTTKITSLQDNYDRLHGGVVAISTFEKIRDKYISSHPGLFMFIDLNGGKGLNKSIGQRLIDYQECVRNKIHRDHLLVVIENLKTSIGTYEQESSVYEETLSRYTRLSEDYNSLYSELLTAKTSLAKLLVDQEACQRFIKMQPLIECLIKEYTDSSARYINTEIMEVASSDIRDIRVELGALEADLLANEMHLNMFDDLTKQLAEMSLEEEAYATLTDLMNPKTGIIAEQIGLQLGRLVQRVNLILKQVWGYDFYIEVGRKDDSDLDYKFPMVVEGKVRKDISLGSTSMLRIINRAFVEALYYNKGCQGLPLFLDEPERGFDEVHSRNIVPYIRDLIDSNRFGQIVLISHSQDNKQAYPDSEVLILDERNIEYKYRHNEHVRFDVN